MGLQLEINSSDIQKAVKEINNIKVNSQDITNALAGIRLILQQDVDLRFMTAPATETGGQVYGGESWEALSDAYLIARPERRNGQILRDTGELMQSMTSSGSPYGIWSTTTDGFVFGTALSKAEDLQKKRPFLFWHSLLIQKVAQYLANYLIS